MIATLDEIKVYLEVTDENFDEKITLIAEWVDEYIKKYTSNNIEASDYVERISCNSNLLFLRQAPVISFTKLELNSWRWSIEDFSDIQNSRYILNPNNWVIQLDRAYYWVLNFRASYRAWYEPNDIPNDLKLVFFRIIESLIDRKWWIVELETDYDKIRYSAVSSVVNDEIHSFLDKYKITNL